MPRRLDFYCNNCGSNDFETSFSEEGRWFCLACKKFVFRTLSFYHRVPQDLEDDEEDLV